MRRFRIKRFIIHRFRIRGSGSPRGTCNGSLARRPSGGSAEEQAAHVSAVISELKVIDADIVLLQEIRDPAALQEIIKAIPEYSLDVVSDFRGNLEVAILSRAPAKATEGFMQAFEEGEEANPPRGFAYATVMLTDESVLAVYSVHLKSNSGGIEETTPKREESARQLIAHCNGLKERFEKEGKAFCAVIGGDFNSDPTSEKWAEDDTLGMIQDAGFRWAGQAAGAGRNSRKGRSSFSWILG